MKNLIFLLLILTFACSPDSEVMTKETVERFRVVLLGDSLKIENLEFKESKIYNAKNQIAKRIIYFTDGKVKGFENIKYHNNIADSEYYSSDSILLSFYKYRFENEILLEKTAFDASDSTLIRTEQYNYDDNGNQIEKIIVNADGMIAQVYKFAFDNFGNELGFSVFDSAGNMILIETHRIVELDKKNRWTKKYSERKDIVKSYYTRKFSKLNIDN